MCLCCGYVSFIIVGMVYIEHIRQRKRTQTHVCVCVYVLVCASRCEMYTMERVKRMHHRCAACSFMTHSSRCRSHKFVGKTHDLGMQTELGILLTLRDLHPCPCTGKTLTMVRKMELYLICELHTHTVTHFVPR